MTNYDSQFYRDEDDALARLHAGEGIRPPRTKEQSMQRILAYEARSRACRLYDLAHPNRPDDPYGYSNGTTPDSEKLAWCERNQAMSQADIDLVRASYDPLTLGHAE